MYMRIDERLEIKEYRIHGRVVSHVVTRRNKDNSISIIYSGTFEECKLFCGNK